MATADKSMTTTVSRLTMGTALKIAKATIEACRKKGVQVSVTVVDRDGIPQIALRDTLAPPLSLAISRKKAYTAAMFKATGSVLETHRAHSPLAQLGEGLAFVAGSVPIAIGLWCSRCQWCAPRDNRRSLRRGRGQRRTDRSRNAVA